MVRVDLHADIGIFEGFLVATGTSEHPTFHRVTVGQGGVQLDRAFRVTQGAFEIAVDQQLLRHEGLYDCVIGFELECFLDMLARLTSRFIAIGCPVFIEFHHPGFCQQGMRFAVTRVVLDAFAELLASNFIIVAGKFFQVVESAHQVVVTLQVLRRLM